MTDDVPRPRPGRPYPLGATWDGGGVNFSLFSEHATAVALCLYDERDPGKEIRQIRIEQRTDQVWHVYVPGLRPGALYAYLWSDFITRIFQKRTCERAQGSLGKRRHIA